MRAVMLDVPPNLLDERRKLGLDRFDELWNGELHMVPPPNYAHQEIGSEIHSFLAGPLRKRGIKTRYETGVFRPGSGGLDYRVPDLLFHLADAKGLITRRGVEGAPLCVLEIRSRDDETYDKLPFYAELGVREVVVIEPDTRAAEVFRLAGANYVAVSADDQGRLHSATLDARFSTVAEGPRLRVEHGGESLEV